MNESIPPAGAHRNRRLSAAQGDQHGEFLRRPFGALAAGLKIGEKLSPVRSVREW
jgi:hypothetical protein